MPYVAGMVTRKPNVYALYLALFNREKLQGLALYTAPLILVGILFTGSYWYIDGACASLISRFSGNASVVSKALGSFPYSTVDKSTVEAQQSASISVLSPSDQVLYSNIFQAQKIADWQKADADIAQLRNLTLLGYVLAERYKSTHYTITKNDLVSWLNDFYDHPQANAIRTLALSKYPGISNALPTAHKQLKLFGYGDGAIALSADDNASLREHWTVALNLWKSGDKLTAAKRFAALADNSKNPTSWNVAAASYWAARAYGAAGNKTEESHYLRQAAEDPRSFYGILACKRLGKTLEIDAQPAALTDSGMRELYNEPAIRRIFALTQMGMQESAEQEMRALFPQYDDDDKVRLLALAHRLHLASVQIAMAKQLSNDSRKLDFAQYPIPHWQPQDGFSIEPALIYAMAKQESGFHPTAVSANGALGLMQLMPQTALLVKKQLHQANRAMDINVNVSEPAFNLMLGQNYVKRLLDNGVVEHNLIYLLAAYNAGPGKLQEWKQTIKPAHDPLLFLESIPCTQTRNYVMKVMTNYWIYKELAGKPSNSIQALLNGHWPSYDDAQPLTVLASRDVANNERLIP